MDEQHRFGVGQRLSLSEKGLITDNNDLDSNEEIIATEPIVFPHQLNMSATPSHERWR